MKYEQGLTARDPVELKKCCFVSIYTDFSWRTESILANSLDPNCCFCITTHLIYTSTYVSLFISIDKTISSPYIIMHTAASRAHATLIVQSLLPPIAPLIRRVIHSQSSKIRQAQVEKCCVAAIHWKVRHTGLIWTAIHRETS